MASDSTSLMASSTRRILSEAAILALQVRPRRNAPLDAHALGQARVEPAAGAGGEFVRATHGPGAPRSQQRRALPGVLVGDLRDGEATALAEPRLDGVELRALGLQRGRLGEVEVDPQDGDEGVGQRATRACARPAWSRRPRARRLP